MEMIPQFLDWLDAQSWPGELSMFAVGLVFLFMIWMWGAWVGHRIWWVRGAMYANRKTREHNYHLRLAAWCVLYHPDEEKTPVGTKVRSISKLLGLDEKDFVRDMELLFIERRKGDEKSIDGISCGVYVGHDGVRRQ